jgi:hypothetical protein
LGAKISDDLVDAALLDRAQAARGDPQAHEATLALDPKAMDMQIR